MSDWDIRRALRQQLINDIPDDKMDEAVEVAYRMGISPYDMDENDVLDVAEKVGVNT